MLVLIPKSQMQGNRSETYACICISSLGWNHLVQFLQKAGCQTFLECSTQDLTCACEHKPVAPVSGKIQTWSEVVKWGKTTLERTDRWLITAIIQIFKDLAETYDWECCYFFLLIIVYCPPCCEAKQSYLDKWSSQQKRRKVSLW